MSEKQKKIAGVIAIFLVILFFLAFTFLLGKPLLALAEDPSALKVWAEKTGFLAKVIFVGMVSFQVVVALVPGEPLEIAAGVAFGSIEGTFLCLLGIFLGSMVVFFLVRKLGIKLVEVFFPAERVHSLRFLKNDKRVEKTLFLIMMIPGTPKDLVNYFVPLTKIKPRRWLFLTIFARIPSVVTSTVGGNAFQERKYIFAIILFAATAVISILGAALFEKFLRFRQRRKAKKN